MSRNATLLHLAYNTGLSLAWPCLLSYYIMRSHLDGKYSGSFRERMGLGIRPFAPARHRVWFHALSVGEAISAVPLVNALKEKAPETDCAFSTATETGMAIARERLAQWVDSFFYLPHDFPWAVDALVNRVRPSMFILVETDAWPNLLRSLKRRKVKSILVNGRLSPRSFNRMRRLDHLFGSLYGSFDHIFAQSLEDKARYEALGVPSDRVTAAGNLKFDSAGAPLPASEVAMLRMDAGIGEGRQVWIAGSTHDGEEEVLLEVHRRLLRTLPDLLLVVAPRQIGRTSSLLSLCTRLGLSAAVRSRKEPATGKAVYLLDTLGELAKFYALGDVAFIGGSLVPFGGHNPLEAIAQGKPAVWGPHLHNFREIERGLLDAGCCLMVPSLEDLQVVLSRWLGNPQLRYGASKGAGEFFNSRACASQKITMFVLDDLLWTNSLSCQGVLI